MPKSAMSTIDYPSKKHFNVRRWDYGGMREFQADIRVLYGLRFQIGCVDARQYPICAKANECRGEAVA